MQHEPGQEIPARIQTNEKMIHLWARFVLFLIPSVAKTKTGQRADQRPNKRIKFGQALSTEVPA
jgi:hypothetical protein